MLTGLQKTLTEKSGIKKFKKLYGKSSKVKKSVRV